MNKETILTVGVLTYNEENYIRKCLDGILMQITDFKYEIIINDDCSTDNTINIIKEYEKNYPDIIKPIFHEENQHSKGIAILRTFVLPKVQTKYFAMCEGDDYWTDEYKLQKQVDFLEAHPEFSACFHPVKIVWENNKKRPSVYPTEKMMKRFMNYPSPQPSPLNSSQDRECSYAQTSHYENKEKVFSCTKDMKETEYKVITFQDLLKCNYIQTNSIVYRWEFIDKDIKDFFPNGILPGDWYLHLLHAKEGNIAYLPDNIMAVYRKHEGGIWYDENSRFLKYSNKIIKFYYSVWKNITNSSDDYWNEIAYPAIKEVIDCLYNNKQIDKLLKVKDEFPETFEQVFKDAQIQQVDKYAIKYQKYKKLYNIFLFTTIVLLLNILLFILHL